ncbi:LuxR C-terminal-related transcriptional regulator [Curtobacterium sp. L1-20]|uniref:helix-turn-helix transcriptional regulator n=1 Tax=Curtobacterium sp. L1-20 TaxID=3138181 RepID=UPI003B52DE90
MNPTDLPSAVDEAARTIGVDAAAALIEDRWDELAATAPDHLLAAIKILPSEAVIRNPGLLVAAHHLSHVVAGGDPGRVHPALEHPPAAPVGQSAFQRLIQMTADSAAARTRDDSAEAARIAEDALALAAAAPLNEVADIAKSMAHLRMQWARSLDAAAVPRAAVEYERAYDLARATGQPYIARRAAASSAWLHAERGRTDIATTWVQRAYGEGVTDSRYDAALLVTEALMRVDRDDLPGAAVLLDEAETLGLGEYWAPAMWVRSMYAHNVADAAVTESRLELHLQAHPVLRSAGVDGRLARAARVRVLLLRGRILDDLDSLVDLSGSDRVIAAAIAQVQRRHRVALDFSAPVTEDGIEPRLQSNALLIHAAAAHALGYTETATHAFTRADALIQHAGMHASYEAIAPAELEQLVQLTGGDTRTATRIGSARRDLHELTRRENDILALLTTDLTASEIASTLFISINTMKSTTKSVYRKLDVNSRAQAVDYAHRAGLTHGRPTER